MTASSAKVENHWPAARVELWPLTKIQRYAKNPKQHTPEQIRELAAMMREFGVTTAILLDESGEIIAGHGRLEAAAANGYAKYPVMVAAGWSEAQKKAYRLADNIIPNALGAALMPEAVKLELADLGELDYDTARFGLDDIPLPELNEPSPTRAPRSKTTIFVSVKNADTERARKVITAALKKAGIEANL